MKNEMKRLSIPKALMLSLGLALTLLVPKTTTAQYGESTMIDWNNYWDNPAESSYDMSDIGMFDWADFTDLFDQATQIDVVDNWATDFRLFDFSELGQMRGNYDIDRSVDGLTVNTQDFGTPLGSGIIILLAAGAGYAALKRKEEQE